MTLSFLTNKKYRHTTRPGDVSRYCPISSIQNAQFYVLLSAWSALGYREGSDENSEMLILVCNLQLERN